MVTWRETAVHAPAAPRLLAEYFESRAAGFPPELGEYRTTFPTPADFVPPAGVFLVVEQGGADVGCGGIRTAPAGPERLRFAGKHPGVQPQTRGSGLGRRLLAELEERARAFGADELVLDTN